MVSFIIFIHDNCHQVITRQEAFLVSNWTEFKFISDSNDRNEG